MKTLITKISVCLVTAILLVPVIINDAAARGGTSGGGGGGGGGGGSSLTAVRVSGDVLVSAGSSVWNNATAQSYGMMFNDSVEGSSQPGSNITVKAIHNGTNIAFLLTWDDATKNTMVNGVEDFSDRGGIMFDAGGTMCNMGSEASPVNVWFWHAARNAVQNIIAGGLGTITRTGDDNISVISNHTGSQWQVVLSRPLASISLDNQVDLVPGSNYSVDFAKWDGANRERNGKKYVTGGRITMDIAN